MSTSNASTASVAGLSLREMRMKKSKAGVEVLVLDALASLKLTVALFVLGIFVILVGTLAQVKMDIWEVTAKYFHTWVMWVDLSLFFPPSFFPDWIPEKDLFTGDKSVPSNLAEVWNWLYFHAGFPAPGGWFVGILMGINLLAAHLWRFKLQAKGSRLLTGIAVITVGCLFTAAVILGGSGAEGEQAKPMLQPLQIWSFFKVILAIGWVAVAWKFGHEVLSVLFPPSDSTAKSPLSNPWVLTLASFVFVGVSTIVFLLMINYLVPQPEATRILWQLLIAGSAGVVLYVGCALVFMKRAGVVLLHAGIGLLMINELAVNRTAVEWQVSLEEGQTANYLRDIRTTELAIVSPGDDGEDQVTAIPRQLIEDNWKANLANRKAKKELEPIVAAQLKNLPFDVRVVEYYKNSDLSYVQWPEEQKNLATAGKAAGSLEMAVPRGAATGTDMGGGVDMASAYVQLTEKGSGKDLGTFLVAQLSAEQDSPERFAEKLTLDGKSYELYLRFERSYRDFDIRLVDVRKDDYLGTSTVRNYSSDVVISRKGDKETAATPFHIRMNDPLRYSNITFYQSGYAAKQDGKEITTLSAVFNRTWMIPYVACMIVAVGMLGHFFQNLLAFLLRANREESVAKSPVYTVGRKSFAMLGNSGWGLAVVTALILFGMVVLSLNRPLKSNSGFLAMQLQEKSDATKNKKVDAPVQIPMDKFAQVLVVQGGRAKPLDTVARNTLRSFSGKEIPNFAVLQLVDGKPVKDKDGSYKVYKTKWKTQPVDWLLHSITQQELALYARQFKIDSPEVVKIFTSQPNKGNMYSIFEMRDGLKAFSEREGEVRRKTENKTAKLTAEERKILEVGKKLSIYSRLVEAFSPPPLPGLPSEADMEKDPSKAKLGIQNFIAEVSMLKQRYKSDSLPLLIPVSEEEQEDQKKAKQEVTHWQSYPEAWISGYIQARLMKKDPEPALAAMEKLKMAFEDHDPKAFEAAATTLKQRQDMMVRKLNQRDDANASTAISLSKVSLEEKFNRISPFYLGTVLYTFALMLAPLAWLLRKKFLGQTIFSLLLLTLVLHSVALIARIYISGRPPVTNLYSSAVFIAWAGVVAGLALEMVYRIGIGNMVAAMCGFGGLLIAYFLAAGGDTIEVLQAVLDTQFWLATHVVLITLGYAATFVAGMIGILYVIGGTLTRNLDDSSRKDLGRMIYGTTCFAIFCSFIGTVLGGLWADDSWGRFWGWDPKENGALIIVMWNAVLLHARWDKMVGDRGLAVLAIFGNIVTSWSWFGVNELGIGLHSYGFTQGVLLALGVGVFAHLLLIGLGLLPVRLWLSYQASKEPTEALRT